MDIISISSFLARDNLKCGSRYFSHQSLFSPSFVDRKKFIFPKGLFVTRTPKNSRQKSLGAYIAIGRFFVVKRKNVHFVLQFFKILYRTTEIGKIEMNCLHSEQNKHWNLYLPPSHKKGMTQIHNMESNSTTRVGQSYLYHGLHASSHPSMHETLRALEKHKREQVWFDKVAIGFLFGESQLLQFHCGRNWILMIDERSNNFKLDNLEAIKEVIYNHLEISKCTKITRLIRYKVWR